MITEIVLKIENRQSTNPGLEDSILTLKVVADKSEVSLISTAINEAIKKCSERDQRYGFTE